MAVRVGINGFGRIGRNVFRAAHERRGRHRVGRGQRPRPTPRRSPTCSSTTRSSGRSRARSPSTDSGFIVDGKEIKRHRRARPGGAAVGRARRRRRDRVDRPVHRSRERRQAPRRRRQEGASSRRRRPSPTSPSRSASTSTRSTTATSTRSSPTPRARPTAWRRSRRSSRHGRDQARPDDDDPRLHRRPAPAGHAAQGPAPRARRGDQPDPGLDRRGQGDRPGHPRAERQAARLRGPRAGADRLGRRPDGRGRPRDDASRRSTPR